MTLTMTLTSPPNHQLHDRDVRPLARPTVPRGTSPRAVNFAELVAAVHHASRQSGLVVPSFRSPPRAPAHDRTIRWRADGSAIVAIRTRDREQALIARDVIEGVLEANRLREEDRRATRMRLQTHLAALGVNLAAERSEIDLAVSAA